MSPADGSGTFEVPINTSKTASLERLSDDWIYDPNECFGPPPMSEEWLAQLAKAKKLTLQERIQQRIKHGDGWQWRL